MTSRLLSPSWLAVPCVLLAAALAIAWSGNDIPYFRAAHHAAAPLGAAVWQNITLLGYGAAALALAAAWLPLRPQSAWAGLLGAIPAALLTRGFKGMLPLPRPVAVLGSDVTLLGPNYAHTSFPSGDAMTIFVLAGVAWWTYRDARVRAAILAVAMVVAASRIAIGVHWPTDVLAGAGAGWICAWIGVRAAERWPVESRRPILPIVSVVLVASCIHLLTVDLSLPFADPLRRALAGFGIGCALLALWGSPWAETRIRPGLSSAFRRGFAAFRIRFR